MPEASGAFKPAIEPLESAPPPDPATVVEVKSKVGRILAEKDAHVLTDSLVENGYWDPTISGLIKMILRPGMTFVDAGANIGYFTLLASRIVGKTGRVFAIEPDPANLSILLANVERNKATNVTVLPMAAWTEKTELFMARPEEEGAVAQVGDSEMGSGHMVPAAPLDDVIDGPVDYMKIDCEYTDHVVVNSSRRLLEQNPSMVISVEFHPHEDSHTGDTPAQILEQYKALDLRPYEIAPDGTYFERSDYERIAGKPMPKGHNCFDFALARELPKQARIERRKGLLEKAGDLLEYVPAAIRPPIRERDRVARRAGSDQ